MKFIPQLFTDRKNFLLEIQNSVRLGPKLLFLFLTGFICSGLYGFMIGYSHSLPQAFSSSIKLPLLYNLTLLICCPTLYVFNSLFGSTRSPVQTLAYVLTANAVTALILAALAPVVLYFLFTVKNYQFFKLLNIAVFTLSGLIGVRFLYQASSLFPEGEEGTRISRLRFLKFWLVLYALIGSQLAWTLRPFFGAPTLPFEILRGLQGNFFIDIARSIGNLLGFY